MIYRRVKYRHTTLYIPIWLYSNKYFFYYIEIRYSLYIPIWLYSNENRGLCLPTGLPFTFQSGYIQMTAGKKMTKLEGNFTFQSGYIQILASLSSLSLLAICFTFQSGYIQITNKAPHFHLVENFTFQSGYIQIRRQGANRSYGEDFTFQSGYIQMQ